MAPPDDISFLSKIILNSCVETHDSSKTFKKILKETKNQIHRDVALGELIFFAIYGNFPKRLFRAVEALEVCENMQKITFFLI